MNLKGRYDFVLLFDVCDGNPNGDPDAGNLPRIDPETGNGLVTDVCIKRKIRNYVGIVKEDQPPYEIYVKEKAVLNNLNKRAFSALGVDIENDSLKRKGGDRTEEAKLWMCKNFYDIRTFGAVMATKINCGQVRGPVQLTFARSIDPVVISEHSITRMAVTTEEEAMRQSGENRTMGRKYTIPYGLYRSFGFVSPHLANQTGFSTEDLDLLWEALLHMFDYDRSAARGFMSTQRLIIFEHESMLGDKPAQNLFSQVLVERTTALDNPPRRFSDYRVSLGGKVLEEEMTIVKA
ncbi:type I-C CRISPR-associated protein Cas7/Csd2 [uncultured Sphaerochaeta sp.]|uniref:type I-C CRISPR-associated protein Cas7/Csd2 n=1 Tax=uncultured Sphaerochaeta sp. TaxID=886478 RepID=UPI002A0A668D|nr:type I-C CRISPR-associated protein Cas7/Csd2 [uncultured Sphaerochaeta sp.]